MTAPTRRTALTTLGTTLAATFATTLTTTLLPRRAPALIPRDRDRPRIDQGIAAGDPTPGHAIIWSRADRPATLRVETSRDPRFSTLLTRHEGPDALPATDYTTRLALRDLPPATEIHYRVTFRDHQTGATSEPATGRFRTPTSTTPTRPYTFAWSGDTCGQGFGINPDLGAIHIHDRIRAHRPDLFMHCGDLIYADAPLTPEKRLPDGRIWRNLVTPAKTKVAETLAEFRGNFRYNHLDPAWRRLIADTALVVQWDDHETKNNWWPGRTLTDARYTQRNCDHLAAHARRAFFEYTPIAARPDTPGRIYRALPQGPLLDLFVLDARSHRAPNGPNDQPRPGPATAFFGPPQLDWLCRALTQSTATWKLIASDQPLSLVISHEETHHEGLANGRGGRPLGREHELAQLLAHIKTHNIQNVVFITADVHYAAAHRFDPARAAYRNFTPFWEFVAGPLNAGTFGPNPHDPTFGPEEKFIAIPRDLPPGLSPLDGHQFYGTGTIDPQTRGLTIALHRGDGTPLYTVEIDAR